MDYDFEAGPEDEVIAREAIKARARWVDAPLGRVNSWHAAVAPLVRALLALLAVLGARSLREALERAANPVRAAIDEDDRKTAERWARATQTWWGAYMGAAEDVWDQTPPELREPQMAAMLPLVREARQARADALAEHSSAGWAVVTQIGKALGLPEDASTKAIVDDVRRLAERVHVEMKLGDALRGELDAARAEVARLTAPVDVDAELYNLAADMKSHATVYDWLRPTVERGARLQRELQGCEATAGDLAEQLVEARAEIARLKSAPGEVYARCAKIADGWDTSSARAIAEDIRAVAAVESPAPALTEEEAREWARDFIGPGCSERARQDSIAAALLAASRGDISAEVRPAPEMVVTTGQDPDDERMRIATQAVIDEVGCDAEEAGSIARAVVDALFNDAPASVDPRRMRPDSEEWVERAPGLSVHQPRPEPEACNVDHSDDKRPAVLGGECAKCLHRPPLHEATCTKARCDGHGQAPSLAGSMARDLLDKLPHGGGQ